MAVSWNSGQEKCKGYVCMLYMMYSGLKWTYVSLTMWFVAVFAKEWNMRHTSLAPTHVANTVSRRSESHLVDEVDANQVE